MESFKSYKKSLEDLSPSAILGNELRKKSKLPTSQAETRSATSRASSLASLSRTPRPSSKSRVRKLSETEISPEKQESKASRMNCTKDEIDELINNALSKQAKELKDTTVEFKDMLETALKQQSKDLKEEQNKGMVNLENTMSEKFLELNNDITDIKNKQGQETEERVLLAKQVDLLTQQVQTLTTRLDSVETPDIDDITEKMSAKFSKQIQTTHFQNLANDIRQTENGLMLFGYTPNGGPDLAAEIKQKILVEKLQVSFDVGNFQVEMIGRGEPGKRVAPLKLTLANFGLRNKILQLGSKLPKGLKIEKCLPKDYRSMNKDFLHLGWQLKLAKRNTVKTRVVLIGHLLCLQVKKHDEGEIRYDWVIHKEWCPPQKAPSDKAEVQKTRVGLTPTPGFQDKDKAYVMFSDLTPDPSGEKHLVPYLLNEYLEPRHKHHIKDTVDNSDKNMIFIKVQSREICEHWLEVYSKKEFNGKVPTVQIMF